MKQGQPVTFGSWMLFCAPLMLFNLCIAWLWLQVVSLNSAVIFIGHFIHLNASKSFQYSLPFSLLPSLSLSLYFSLSLSLSLS